MDSETTLPIAKATMILRGEKGVGGSFGKLQSTTQAQVGNGLVARLPATATRHSCWVQARGLGVVVGWCMQVSSRTPESYSPSLDLFPQLAFPCHCGHEVCGGGGGGHSPPTPVWLELS